MVIKKKNRVSRFVCYAKIIETHLYVLLNRLLIPELVPYFNFVFEKKGISNLLIVNFYIMYFVATNL